MIIPTSKEHVRVDAQEGIMYKLEPGIEDQRLTVINESTEHPVIWDDQKSNVKRIKETRGIPKLAAENFVWHEDAWWYEDDWYNKMCG